MLIRREIPSDAAAIRSVTAAAFKGAAHSAPPVESDGAPGEATLVGWLRADAGWIPELSMVACRDEEVIGHVVCTRADVAGAPVLVLGPLSVLPDHQRSGVGSALMHAVLGAADALGEALVALVGDPAYYARFGFVAASSLAIDAPDPAWGPYFQARPLTAYEPSLGGRFTHPAPFDQLAAAASGPSPR
jgi:putative acetyltransferase